MRRLDQLLSQAAERGDHMGPDWVIEHLERRLADEPEVVVALDIRRDAGTTTKERPTTTDTPPTSWWIRPIVALTAFAVVAVAVLAAIILVGGNDEQTAAGDGVWERAIFQPRFTADDLRETSFGLVAAAGPDGVWISTDGADWQQALVVSEVSAIAEHHGALYAFSTTWPEEDEKRTSVWRSEDGLSWEEILIEDFPQIIEAVAGPDALLLVGRDVRYNEAGDLPPTLATVIFRSTDGREWTRVNTSGLDGFVVWAISEFDGGYIALGEATVDRGAVLASPDGVTWTEVAAWTVTTPTGDTQPMNRSAWPLVDLFETPSGLVAVGSWEDFYQGPLERRLLLGSQPRVILATSADGQTFEILDEQTQLFLLEDLREETWPPLQSPEGTMFGDRIILLGHSYPDNYGQPTHHQWTWTPPPG